jgi:hypothetical protein
MASRAAPDVNGWKSPARARTIRAGPVGLERRTIDAYERLSDVMLKLDIDPVQTQRHRQELCEHALTVLQTLNRDRF